MRPLIVAEGDGVFAEAVAELRRQRRTVVEGWGRDAEICAGVVACADDAVAALLAAVEGRGVVIDGRADREVLDRLCNDLRTLGPLDHRLARRPRPALTREQRELLVALQEGASLGEAAARLHISRRTADRRLAAARAVLGAATTAEALVLLARSGS